MSSKLMMAAMVLLCGSVAHADTVPVVLKNVGPYEWNGEVLIVGQGISYDANALVVNITDDTLTRIDPVIYNLFQQPGSIEAIGTTFLPTIAPMSGLNLDQNRRIMTLTPTMVTNEIIHVEGTTTAIDGTVHQLQSPTHTIRVRKAGDADGDGVVGALDLAIILMNVGQVQVGYAGGDFNLDGVVDFSDYLIYYWTNRPPIQPNGDLGGSGGNSQMQ